MQKIGTCFALLVTIVTFSLSPKTADAQRDFTRDNIVFIFVDDMGYGDLTAERMPKLDALIRSSGTRFSNFIVNQNCTPSRVAFLTGNDPARYDMYSNFPLPVRKWLPKKEELVSERLKTLGYSTCMVGKWGVGRAFSQSAHENGFDEAFQNSRINNVPYKTNRFSDIYQTDAAIKFLKVAEEPLFLYAPFESPHAEYKAPREYFDLNRNEFGITGREEAQYLFEEFGIVAKRPVKIPTDVKLRIDRCLYYSMISVLDDQVARLYETLEEEGKADHTLFMFASDNGGITPIANNGVYRDRKADVHEGGHRSCNGIIWPGVVKRDQAIDSNVWVGDMFATFADIAGESKPGIGLDGASAIPAILKNVEIRRGVKNDNPALVAHVGKTRRVNKRKVLFGEFGVWRLDAKYIRFTDFTLQGKVLDVREELYILSKDPGETNNLVENKNFQGLLKKMQKEYDKWGGDKRLLSLRIDDHSKDNANFKHPASWSKFNDSLRSQIWP